MSSEYSNQSHQPEVDMSNDEYLDKKIRCLVEPLITSLLVERPKEPVKFISMKFLFYFLLKLSLIKKYFQK
jgi:hypothetical protein